ncbi:hypothetical protein BDF19DRAFT_425460 [Syncephalis fuscata]|nr:hypothetical protein BDF19DRAFT_425460 [Syncephalis fuscata]
MLLDIKMVSAISGRADDPFIDSKQSVPNALGQTGLEIVEWRFQTKYIGLARVLWKNTLAFLKCMKNNEDIDDEDSVEQEMMAYKKVLKYDQYTANQEIRGKQHVQHPMHTFPYKEGACFVYSYAGNMNIFEYFKKLSWQEKGALLPRLIFEVLDGLWYLHNAGIAHGDINERNIMLSNTHDPYKFTAIIIDYDLSNELVERPVPDQSSSYNAFDFSRQNLDDNSLKYCHKDFNILGTAIHKVLTGKNMLFFFSNQLALREEYLQKAKRAIAGQTIALSIAEPPKVTESTQQNQLYPDSSDVRLAKLLVPIIEVMNKLVRENLNVYLLPEAMFTDYSY